MNEPSLPEESIFAQALDLESAAERAAYLDLKQARFPTPAGHPNVRRTEGTATSLLHKAVGFSST